jgi:sterol desaturase/sphingolipid hydroxylase (fatty acid hydroxylase superfamily)
VSDYLSAELFLTAWRNLVTAAGALFWPALAFALLAFVVKGREALAAARAALAETRINLCLFVVDALLVLPLLGLLNTTMTTGVSAWDLALVAPAHWAALPDALVLFAAVFLGDFVAYWRHRLEHSRALWPAHAVHHSDTRMTWLTLTRFHPVNRLSTDLIDAGCLALLGFPLWALIANNLLRHYYGMVIHADLPWTYGAAGRVFVSPVMHRWHHVREGAGVGSNFATVFALFDRAFGSFYLPGRCCLPLGVAEDMGRGAWGQLCHPLLVWARPLRRCYSAAEAFCLGRRGWSQPGSKE